MYRSPDFWTSLQSSPMACLFCGMVLGMMLCLWMRKSG